MNTNRNCFDYIGNNFQRLKDKIVVKQKEKKKTKTNPNQRGNSIIC